MMNGINETRGWKGVFETSAVETKVNIEMSNYILSSQTFSPESDWKV